jgi:transposase
MTGYINNSGYLMVTNDKGELPHQIQFHKYIVQKAYGIKIPKGFVVHHKDENKLNNALDNLIVMTVAGHIRWHQNGEKSTNAKLTTEQILEIRYSFKLGLSPNLIAKQFNISARTVYAVIHGRTWKHLELRDISEHRLLTPAGEKNGRATLTEEKVLAIRKRLEAGETCKNICIDYGVSRSLISNIKHNRLWAHIQPTGIELIHTRNTGGAKGSKNGSAKLTENSVIEIKHLLRTTVLTNTAIGIKFGVTNAAISKIKLGLSWINIK